MSATVTKVEVPDIGDFDSVPVIEILVAVGDSVAAEDPLVTLESDKATMDVPAPFAGVIKAIEVEIGDRVAQGSALMSIEAAGEEPAREQAVPLQDTPPDPAPPEPPPAGEPPSPARTPEAPPNPLPGDDNGPIYASPSARRMARELSVELDGVSGSGRKGRITKDDVQHLSEGASAPGGLHLAPWPKLEFEKYGPVQRVARSRIQKIAAPNLARNWVTIPHVTHNDDADITELEAWRKTLNDSGEVKFTMVSFLVAACVAALKAFPDFNSSLDGDELIVKRYYNIGFAADTPDGLVVPVIKGADGKGLTEIARELTALSGRAREGKLGLDEITGATFTISSLGGIGGTSFTPIVNAPEVAILGVTRAAMRPVWDEGIGSFAPRLIVPLSLSYDHRVIDGAAAARFTAYLAGVLSDLRRTML